MGNTGPEDLKVLVVEDDRDVAEIIRIALTDAGYYHTVPAVTGADALKKIHSGSWDGIILDACLPDFDGGYILQQKNSRSETKDIPVVLISASEHQLRELAEKHNIQGLLTKPFDLDMLVQTANQAFCRPSPLIAACTR